MRAIRERSGIPGGPRWAGRFLLAALLLAALAPAPASAAGGSNIATAPNVVYGQHTFGNTGRGEWDCGPAEFWNLAMNPGDQVTVDWAAADRDYAVKAVIYPAGTTDFSINNVESVVYAYIGENNHAEMTFSTGTAGSYPLIFEASGCGSGGHPGPYDFTVTLQRALTISLKNYTHIRTTTVISASANLADGSPVPDGMAFTLTVGWHSPDHESVLYTATSVGGAFSFPLSLPETAKGKKATLVVSRGPDPQFLGAESAKVEVKVGRGSPPPTPCELATARAHSLARRHHRLARRARFARGRHGRRLRHRARLVGRRLRAARANAATACATA